MMSILKDRDIRKENAFGRDVFEGLSKYPKQISSKYFYNEKGNELFQEIMHLPEYYPTRCEYEILSFQKAEILRLIDADNFQLIDLGAGDGLKTTLLLEYFIDKGVSFEYRPVDISQDAIDRLLDKLKKKLPELKAEGQAADYFDALNKLKENKDVKKVVLFLGSNIGNFTRKDALVFLHKLSKSLNKGDLLLLGADLKKDPSVIMKAYNDNQGITAAFNYNLLIRMNDELDANFNLPHFLHAPAYDPVSGELKSYIISRMKQTVTIQKLHKTFNFDAWETILTEYSNKYDIQTLEKMAKESGFLVEKQFIDRRQYFADFLLKVK
jgi:dimethylhistidine N-methyltransferase